MQWHIGEPRHFEYVVQVTPIATTGCIAIRVASYPGGAGGVGELNVVPVRSRHEPRDSLVGQQIPVELLQEGVQLNGCRLMPVIIFLISLRNRFDRGLDIDLGEHARRAGYVRPGIRAAWTGADR